MLLNITIASILMTLTTAIHAGGMMFVMKVLDHRRDHFNHRWQRTSICWVAGTVLVLFFLGLPEVLLWAYTFILVGAIQGVEAVNGIIMFGWTTAIVIAIVQRIYFGGKNGSYNGD